MVSAVVYAVMSIIVSYKKSVEVSFSLPAASVSLSRDDVGVVGVDEGAGASDGAHPARNVEPITPVITPAFMNVFLEINALPFCMPRLFLLVSLH